MESVLVPIDTGRSKPYMLEITTQDVPMRGLPEALHGATFAHISDIHGGFGNTEAVYEEAIARVNAADPDFVLFTGDYIDDSMEGKEYPIDTVLSRFKARRGVFGSLGNHDHRRGPAATQRVVEKAGVNLLVNENVRVEPGLWIVGLDDFFEGKPDIERGFAGVPDDVTAIVLSHNPRMIERLGNYDALVLSGHTHGAQIRLPILTPKLVCWLHLRCPQVAGWYRNGRARLYVNRGLGVTGKPFRYNCPAEVGIFRMVPDTQTPNTDCRSTAAAGAKR